MMSLDDKFAQLRYSQSPETSRFSRVPVPHPIRSASAAADQRQRGAIGRCHRAILAERGGRYDRRETQRDTCGGTLVEKSTTGDDGRLHAGNLNVLGARFFNLAKAGRYGHLPTPFCTPPNELPAV